MTGQAKRKIPMDEGRVRITPGGGACLIGMRCRSCGETVYPRSVLCPNCSDGDLEEVALSTRGKIWSYTVVYQSYGNVIGLTPPYVAAFVELPEGAYVHTPIVECDPEKVEIGMDVELDLIKVGETDEGEEVTCVFKPAK